MIIETIKVQIGNIYVLYDIDCVKIRDEREKEKFILYYNHIYIYRFL